MSAIKFIKLYGLNSARVTVEDAQENTHYCTEAGYQSTKLDVAYEPCPDCVSIPDLKRPVESVDLIGKYHSIDHAKNHYNNMREALNQYQYENKDIEDLSNELKQAIADYEEIYKCTYCNGFGEAGCQFEGTFTCPDCNGDRYVGGEHV